MSSPNYKICDICGRHIYPEFEKNYKFTMNLDRYQQWQRIDLDICDKCMKKLIRISKFVKGDKQNG